MRGRDIYRLKGPSAPERKQKEEEGKVEGKYEKPERIVNVGAVKCEVYCESELMSTLWPFSKDCLQVALFLMA